MSCLIPPSLVPTETHRDFETALEQIDASIRYHFRSWRWSDDHREEAFAEARAATWVAWHGLLGRGQDPIAVGITGIVGFACRGVLGGRAVGANRSRGRGAGDLHHPRCGRSGNLHVLSLDEPGEGLASWQDWLSPGRRYGPAEEAAFRIDFAAWLEILPARKRRMAELLAEGQGTYEVARKLGVTPGAISQARSWLGQSWREFQGESSGDE